MSLRIVKRICIVASIVTFALLLLGGYLELMILQCAALVLAIADAIFSLIFYRCPHCGHYLGGKRGISFADRYCPGCGERVED